MIATVNGHVLFPAVNYKSGIGWKKRWQTEVCDAEFGPESRYALRKNGRIGISFEVTPHDCQEDSQLIDRIMAAKKSGLACTGYWGRGTETVSVAGDELTIADTEWAWSEDDFLILIDSAGGFEVRQVVTVAGDLLTLDSPATGSYAAQTLFWPLIFGKFSCEGLAALTEDIGEASISITEQTSALVETVGVAEPPIDGIGGWIIEDTFIVQ